MSITQDPTTWESGTVVAHRSGELALISHRKDDNSGWWISGGGGLADRAARSGEWVCLTPEIVQSLFVALDGGTA